MLHKHYVLVINTLILASHYEYYIEAINAIVPLYICYIVVMIYSIINMSYIFDFRFLS